MSSFDEQFSYATLEVTRDPEGRVDGFYFLDYYDHTGDTPASERVGLHCPTEVFPNIGMWLEQIAYVADNGGRRRCRAQLADTALVYDAVIFPGAQKGHLMAVWSMVTEKSQLISELNAELAEMPSWAIKRGLNQIKRIKARFRA